MNVNLPIQLTPLSSVSQELRARAQQLQPQLVSWRRDLHAHPELGFEEFRTSRRISRELKNLGLRVQVGVAETGVVGLLVGGQAGKTIGLRAEMDALPIEEKAEGRPYASRTHGLMHACGHDGHVAIALGVARILTEVRDHLRGAVKFLFQPGEERPKVVGGPPASLYQEGVHAVTGASMMVDEGALARPRVDGILGIHLWPALEVGSISLQPGPSMAGVGNFHATLLGRSAHAAMPDRGIDAIAAATQWIPMAQAAARAAVPPGQAYVFHVGTIQGGYRRNVIADRVDITGTVRAYDSALLTLEMPRLLEATLQAVCEIVGTSYNLDYCPLLPPLMNDVVLTSHVAASLAHCLRPGQIVELSEPALTSDDFAVFANHVPATHIKIGCANASRGLTAPLHSTEFDFDEEALAIGVLVLCQAVLGILEDG